MNIIEFNQDEVIKYCDLCNLSYRTSRTLKRQLTSSNDYFKKFSNGIRLLKVCEPEKNIVYYIFRGTRNVKNIYFDLKYQKSYCEVLGFNVHKGFLQCADSIWVQIKDEMKQEALKNKVVVTGHSLGGAIALIIHMYLTNEKIINSQVVTFGQPKITDEAGAKKYKDYQLLRVVNRHDPIPLVPKVMIQPDRREFFHFGDELILMPGLKYIFNSKKEFMESSWEQILSSQRKVRILDHFTYSYVKSLISKRYSTWEKL